MTPEQQRRRHESRVEAANIFVEFINSTPELKTGSNALTIVYSAHVLLNDVITRLNLLERASMSLVAGVEELQAAWPKLQLPSEGPHNDLCGFLFATLPLSQKALK